MRKVYNQQVISGSRVGFRDADADPWQWYETSHSGAVIMMSSDRTGYAPIEGLIPIPARAINT